MAHSPTAPRSLFATGSALAGLLLLAGCAIAFGLEKGLTKTALSGAVSMAAGGFGAAGLLRAAWASRALPAETRPWRLLGGGVAAWTLGLAVRMVFVVGLKAPPFPSLADVFFLAAFPLVMGGVCLLPRQRLHGRERRLMALDMVIVAVAGALVFWNVIVAPQAARGGPGPTLGAWLLAVYPTLEFTLLWPLASLLLLKNARRDQTATVLLLTGFVTLFVADCSFATKGVLGSFARGSFIALLHQAAMLLVGLAGLRQSVLRPMAESAAGDEPRPADWRQHLPHAVLCMGLLALAALPVQRGQVAIAPLLAGMSAIIGLVLTRQILALKAHAELFTSLRESHRLLQAETSARACVETVKLAMERRVGNLHKLESLGVLAGGIAHDFNNLLTTILGNATLAQSILNPENPVVPFLGEIEQAALRAATLSQQMLAYSGCGRMAPAPLKLNAVAEESAGLLSRSLGGAKMIRCALADALPLIHADAAQIRQMVMNLLLNAVEATAPGDGPITLRTGVMDADERYLVLAANPDALPPGRYVFLEIEDTGAGMDDATRARIFDPFFTTKFVGRGLGLPVTLGIVRGHRGTIAVESQPGAGARFRVLLPPAAEAEIRPQTVDFANAPEGLRTVLLVDDEEPVRKVAAMMLEELGFGVIEAANGREALTHFADRREEIAVVMLDLMMPVMDGATAFRELRRLKPELPVLFASGYSAKDVLDRLDGETPDGFLQKPFTIDSVSAALSAAIFRAAAR